MVISYTSEHKRRPSCERDCSMRFQELGLPVLTHKGEFKTKCNLVKVGHDMSVG